MIKLVKNTYWAVVLCVLLELPAAAASQGLREYRFQDGVRLKVHYNDPAGSEFALSVLDAAVSAYQTLTQFQGFNTPGYSFSAPDMRYAYDPDKTIDIYLGEAEGGNVFEELGVKNKLFKDAPCFDTRKSGPAEYDAMIFLPANYEEFIRNWEKINPSPLGRRNIEVDLRGTLIHEMTHVILFFYNKNLDKAGEEAPPGRRLDWYVEGLARYFETFAGARHDFYSQGFKETLPDKIRFSRGGSNYFMRYPDQAFTGLRYENALFWRFVDVRFGMGAIESLSRKLRGSAGDFKNALQETTGMDFDSLLEQYARAVLLGNFDLKEDSGYLREVARTRLFLDGDQFYLVDGLEGRKHLGHSVRTDWVGRWENVTAAGGEPSVAGDATERSDVSAWATDYAEIRFAPQGPAPRVWLRNSGEGRPLVVQVFLFTKAGSVLHKEPIRIPSNGEKGLGLARLMSDHSLSLSDLDRAVLAVTNTDPQLTAPYEILA